MTSASEIRTILAYAGDEKEEKKEKLLSTGVELIRCGDGEQVDLELLFQKLGERQIDSVLVEGGGTLHGSLLLTGLVNRVYAYVAPKLIGGKEASSPVEGAGFARMREAEVLSEIEIIPFGEDICITGKMPEKEADTCLPE